jgi:N-acetyl-anhydromuramyl-L-alanine amidase AmpD
MENQTIIAANQSVNIGVPVVLWSQKDGYSCPNKRGRKVCTQHDPALNDKPTRPDTDYRIADPRTAYRELRNSVHQLILHYDVCYCSHQCHQLMVNSDFKGSHFYLDIDGTLYQTCDLYWKTNTAPADDRQGNERSIHVEMANLSWQARAAESSLYHVKTDQYKNHNGRWQLTLPEEYKDKIRTPGFRAYAARAYGKRGYFSKRINGRTVRMWDFTEEQYRALIRLCIGVNQLLPRIRLQVPYDAKIRRTPPGKIRDFAAFCGVLGHAHAQNGTADGIMKKHDPGSAFNWSRLRQELQNAQKNREPR